MNSVLKKSLKVPIRKLTRCVSDVKERGTRVGLRLKRSRYGGGRGLGGRGGWRGGRGGRNVPPRARPSKDSTCSYLPDLERERKLREAMNAQKNAERAAMRAHFRKKYQLSKNRKDKNHLNAVRGKVALPPQLAKLLHPEIKSKDDGFCLLNAFQGLSFNMGVVTGSKHSKTPTPKPANGETCKVM